MDNIARRGCGRGTKIGSGVDYAPRLITAYEIVFIAVQIRLGRKEGGHLCSALEVRQARHGLVNMSRSCDGGSPAAAGGAFR